MPTRGVFVSEEASLLANLIENNVEINNSCGGNGTCGTCLIQVIEGLHYFSEVEELEAEIKRDRGFEENERLSCQSFIKGKVTIKIP